VRKRKKILRLVKAYGRDSISTICFRLANSALLGAIPSSNFGLGYAEHELASGVKQTEIRHCTDLGSRQSDFLADSLCHRREGNLTFRRSSRIRPPTETRSSLKRQNRIGICWCCAGTRIGYMKGAACVLKKTSHGRAYHRSRRWYHTPRADHGLTQPNLRPSCPRPSHFPGRGV
jgi:hypothetical protein